jgi:RecB family exonuclease
VDEGAEGTVLVDYKTAEMDDEERADQRAKEDLQLSVYALAWREMTGRMPDRVELRFVTAGTSGIATMTEARIEKTRGTIADAAASIRAGEFQARPSEYACRRCACRPICRESAV